MEEEIEFEIEAEERKRVMVPPRILPWLVAGAFFMQMLDGTILNTALPSIARSIGEKPLEIQSIVVAYFLTVAFLLPLSGWLADRFGSKKIFSLAIVFFTTGSLFCAFSETLTELTWSRVFQAVGGAMMVPVGRLIVLKVYPKHELIKMLSFIMLPALIGPLLGPVAGGFLVEYLSWHWIFLINIPIGIMCLILTWLKMPEVGSNDKYSFDWIGFILFSAAVLLLCVAVNDNKILIIEGIQRLYLGIGAAFLLVLYWAHARHKKRPLFALGILKIRSFVVGGLGSLFSRIGIGGMPYLAPLFMQVGLGFSPSKSGMVMLVQGVALLVAKSFVEPVLRLFGYKRFLFINTLLLGATVSSFSLVGHHTPDWLIMLMFYAMGTINSLQFTSMATLSLIDLPHRYTSEGNTLTSVIMQISLTIGVSVTAVILSNLSDASGGVETLDSFHKTALIMGVFTMLSAVNFLFAKEDAGGLRKNRC